MSANISANLYTAREIARAVGVSDDEVRALLGGARFVGYTDALRLGRLLASRKSGVPADGSPLFSVVTSTTRRTSAKGLPFALSSTLHAVALAAAIALTTFGVAPTIATATADDHADPMRLIFLSTPGPGGGGGGGGLQQRAAPPKARREGRHAISSPLPQRQQPKPIEPVAAPPEPKPAPPLAAEPLPPLIAPVVSAPADARTRVGILEQTTAENDSHGPGTGGGVGKGSGTGIGEGDGAGIGPGSGGGTGGGPYRPGSGIAPPQLLREVKADYTEEARRQGLAGEVLLEIVVRRDGTVGDIKVVRGLGSGLNDRATQAVRQWRFAPARRQGTPVDVIVEVAVEFKLR
jgi:TonB family protein